MRLLKIILPALAIVFIAMQFFPDRIPENKPADENDIIFSSLVNEEILGIIKISCFDCHSNQTHFPWYSKLAPSSWLLAGHIEKGRNQLNFSAWESYNKRKKIGMLEAINEVVTSGEMPLKSYTLIHRDARLSSGEISTLAKWTEESANKLLK
jgi:hypothetical protein